MTCPAIRLLLSVSLAALLGAVLAGGAHAAPPSFSGIGDAPGGPFESRAFAVSNDGVVVGTATEESENPHHSGASRAAVWTQAGGLELLPEAAAGAIDISADGSVVLAVGSGNSGDFLYTEAEGLLPFGEGLKVRALSADGSTVVGRLERPDLSTVEAFRWTAAGGVEGLGFLPHTTPRSQAYAVSDDGSVAVGDGSNYELAPGFVWSAGAGMEPMGSLEVGPQRARVLSGNGIRVAGMSNGEPYLWSAIEWLGNPFTPGIPKIGGAGRAA